MTERDLASFASHKLDLMDAISMDPAISHAEFRVAFRLVQHQNSDTGAIFPSQEALADQTGLKARSVRSAINGLVEKGWLKKVRPNRRLPNFYRFSTDSVPGILAAQAEKREARADARLRKAFLEKAQEQASDRLSGMSAKQMLEARNKMPERQEIAGRTDDERQFGACHERQNLAGLERQEIAGKHLKETPEDERPKEYGSGQKEHISAPQKVGGGNLGVLAQDILDRQFGGGNV